jgi:excisionase family DNA binding protein
VGHEQLLSVNEAAARLGIGRTTLYEMLAAGTIRSVRIHRRRLIREEQIADYVEALTKVTDEDEAREPRGVPSLG